MSSCNDAVGFAVFCVVLPRGQAIGPLYIVLGSNRHARYLANLQTYPAGIVHSYTYRLIENDLQNPNEKYK